MKSSDEHNPLTAHSLLRPELDLPSLVAQARAKPEFLDAVHRLYEELEQVTCAAGIACLGGGACCRFDLADHVLMVSTGELALLAQAPGRLPPKKVKASRCPFQIGPRCHARDSRPLGCRLFYCRDSDHRLSITSEEFHDRLRNLHTRWSICHVYVEMTWALSQFP